LMVLSFLNILTATFSKDLLAILMSWLCTAYT
jgi:hypothetical protein